MTGWIWETFGMMQQTYAAIEFEIQIWLIYFKYRRYLYVVHTQAEMVPVLKYLARNRHLNLEGNWVNLICFVAYISKL